MVYGLVAEDTTLSLTIAAAGSLAALVSVLIAWYVQHDVVRQRRRQELETAIQQALQVQWAANGSAHFWGEPLENYKLAYERVARYDLMSAKTLSEHAEPSEDRSKWVAEATEVEDLALKAARELRKELAKRP